MCVCVGVCVHARVCVCVCREVCAHVLSPVRDSLGHHGLWPAQFLCPWDFPVKNTRVGCHFLVQGNLPTQGLTPVPCIPFAGSWPLGHCTPWGAGGGLSCTRPAGLLHSREQWSPSEKLGAVRRMEDREPMTPGQPAMCAVPTTWNLPEQRRSRHPG